MSGAAGSSRFGILPKFRGAHIGRSLAEEMKRRRWTKPTLEEKAKGDEEKVRIAVRLRRETLVTVAWIARRLRMGSVANVNTLLFHWRRAQEK